MNASTERKRNAAIYRKAAKKIEDCPYAISYSCIAIRTSAPEEGIGAKLAEQYVDVFSHGLRDHEWYTAEGALQIRGFKYGARETGCDENDLRVVALCFMAAMVEAGDA